MARKGMVAVSLSVGDALGRLFAELRRLGLTDAGEYILSSNLRVRLDGTPYTDQASLIPDPGIAIYFRLKGADRVLACDKWNRAADNVAAIAAHIAAIRAIERYGVGTLEQAFAGYAGLPSKGSTWRTTLGFAFDQAVTSAQVEAAFRARAREAHPDTATGSHDAMASLTAARAEALAEIGA